MLVVSILVCTIISEPYKYATILSLEVVATSEAELYAIAIFVEPEPASPIIDMSTILLIFEIPCAFVLDVLLGPYPKSTTFYYKCFNASTRNNKP